MLPEVTNLLNGYSNMQLFAFSMFGMAAFLLLAKLALEAVGSIKLAALFLAIALVFLARGMSFLA